MWCFPSNHLNLRSVYRSVYLFYFHLRWSLHLSAFDFCMSRSMSDRLEHTKKKRKHGRGNFCAGQGEICAFLLQVWPLRVPWVATQRPFRVLTPFSSIHGPLKHIGWSDARPVTSQSWGGGSPEDVGTLEGADHMGSYVHAGLIWLVCCMWQRCVRETQKHRHSIL